ncbi:hypothetical protein MOX02_59740 [Methylobacterium oxalidis]|uniref:Uncharacterized protein n=2 Tax=Methylobacterium oxalidis TaxID=944322 RepID=A0A512JDC5_9HYPH|nr:hypothetical protein MOX02_59740 [Methylobacterium oxalidis]GJE35747.1 hypothetical protein LDDCCGHA_5967 [Methylobacterium oxalidis]GLS66018.1 hypothetical protein GCM10007888_44000 [Methylobacterium oxalidis]
MREQARDFEREQYMLANKVFADQTGEQRMHALEAIKAYGVLSIKTLFLLNGGAILALLTFTASFFSRSDHTMALVGISLAKQFVTAFYFFGAGLASAAIISGIAYVNYSALYHTYDTPGGLFLLINAKDREPTNDVHHRITVVTAWIAIGVACLGLACFLLGAWWVVSAFSVLGV